MENQITTQNPIQLGTHFLIIKGRVVNGKEILKNRTLEFTGYSKKLGFINGTLTHSKTGKLQKTEISIPLDLLMEITPQMETQLVG